MLNHASFIRHLDLLGCVWLDGWGGIKRDGIDHPIFIVFD
jgi:hypothetical protein